MPEQIICVFPVVLPKGCPRFTPYKNSIQVACDSCGCVSWLGPAQQLHRAENQGTKVQCCICLFREYGREALDMIRPLTDKQEGD